MAGDLRSPRKRALEIGTDGSKFVDTDYDSQGGFPRGTPGQGGVYSDSADQAPSTGPSPSNQPNPTK